MKQYNINIKEIVDVLYKANVDKESFTDFFDSLQEVVAMRISLLKMMEMEEINNIISVELPDYFTWVDNKGKGEDKIEFSINIPKDIK